MRHVFLAGAVLGATWIVGAVGHAEVLDDPDLRAVRQALATPVPATLPAREEPAMSRHDREDSPSRSSHDSERQVTIRFRADADESASISVAIDVAEADPDLARWIDALVGSEVFSIEWDGAEASIRID